jgi:hypothetical protein
MDTGLNPSIALNSINNVHLSMYSRTQNSSVSGHNMGVDTTDSLNLSQYFASVSVKLFMNGPLHLSVTVLQTQKPLISTQQSNASKPPRSPSLKQYIFIINHGFKERLFKNKQLSRNI